MASNTTKVKDRLYPNPNAGVKYGWINMESDQPINSFLRLKI